MSTPTEDFSKNDEPTVSVPIGMAKTTKIIIGVVIGVILLSGLGIILYFLLNKGKCSANKDCKDSAKPNCVEKKCVATDVCSPNCKGDTPHCVNNACVGCKTSDDCKGNNSGKTVCSSASVCVVPVTPDVPSNGPGSATAISAFISKYQNKLVHCGEKIDSIENGARRWIINPESYSKWQANHPNANKPADLNADECVTLKAMTDGGNISL